MSVGKDNRPNAQVHAEAVEWLIRFAEDEVDPPGREAFSAWLKRSPEHIDAYLHLVAFWRESSRPLAGEDKVDIDQLVALARGEANVFSFAPQGREAVSPLLRESSRSGLPAAAPGTARKLAVAASILLVSGTAAILYFHSRSASVYATGTGEQRTVNLDDGSTVTINAKSSVRVLYDDKRRLIDLGTGQALFKVAGNSSRPFIVMAGGSTIRALGTQFDVYQKETGTVVTVVEGRVSVTPGQPTTAATLAAPELLSAGEQAVVTAKTLRKGKPAHIEAATAWTNGLLVFDRTPLHEVVAEFNRQNVRPLVLEDAQLRDLEISGVFPSNGSDRMARFLKDRLGVAVSEDRNAIRISRASATP